MKLKEFFSALFRGKTHVAMPLDEEQIQSNKVIESQQAMIASRDATIAELKAEEREKKAEDKAKEKEKELIGRLKEKEKELRDKSIGQPFSLEKFAADLLNPRKLQGRIELVDKEGKEILGILGGIWVLEDGNMSLVDIHGNLVCTGRELAHIIYKPDALPNYIKTRQIRIPYITGQDKRLHYLPDIENLDHPEIIGDKENEIEQETEEKSMKVKDMLINKNKRISEYRRKVERLESIIIELKGERDDLKRSVNLLKTQSWTSQSELSQVMDKHSQLTAKVSDIHRENAALTESKALNEVLISKLEGINGQLLAKMEQLGVKSDFEKALTQILDLIDNLKDKLPNTLIQNIEPEKKEVPVAQPGQHLR